MLKRALSAAEESENVGCRLRIMQNQQGSEKSISELSDAELLSNTRALIGRSNQVFAALLAHLGEVEARGLHRTRACSSLYAYCIYELRLSEDGAVRRVMAARFVRQFPALLPAIASGELHLTGLLMLGPHLTRENQLEVLASAKHRTKKEIAKLVRLLDPLPEVPAKIEVLGPARADAARATWKNRAASLCPVRDLPPGDRPRDWLDVPLDGSAPARIEGSFRDLLPPPCSGSTHSMSSSAEGLHDRTDEPLDTSAPAPIESSPRGDRPRDQMDEPLDTSAPARIEGPFPRLLASDGLCNWMGVKSAEGSAPARVFGPLRYKVQFTATEEFVELIERARALLSKRKGPASIDEIQLEALRVFVASLEKKRYGVSDRRKLHPTRASMPALDFGSDPTPTPMPALGSDLKATRGPRSRSRHVPARVRRAVFDRDGARCTYVDATGRRCEETHYLELHHSEPFAQGGKHAEANLALRCTAHNALAAELDFGPMPIAAKRDALRHLSPSAAAR
jgi:5-methylcytosine-specific restriction endonuclease McrA